MNETEKVQRFLQIAKEEGLSYFAAIGIASNIKHESDWNEGLSEVGGTGFGLGQWTGDTVEESKQKLIAQGSILGLNESQSLSFDGQCRVMCRGDKTGQWSTVSYNYDTLIVSPLSYPEFIALTSVLAASMNFMGHWERPSYDPAINHKDRRKATALEYEQTYPNGDGWGSGSGGSTGGSGLQLAVFPIRGTVYLTQGNDDDFSHFGSSALDFAKPEKQFDYYAPFDMKCLEVNASFHMITWESLEKVKYIDGTEDYVSMYTIHDNEIRWSVGQTVKKNEFIGKSGTGGQATGDHVHLETAKGKYTGGAYITSPSGGQRYNIFNPYPMYNIFSICNNITKETTTIINQTGRTQNDFPWKCDLNYQDGTGGGETTPETKRKNRYILNVINGITPY